MKNQIKEIKKGCGNKITYPDIVCGAMFGGKVYLCEECKEKQQEQK
jgi:hypothetical protein